MARSKSSQCIEHGCRHLFFAKQLYLKHHVPIGIINSSVGGTPIEAWISEEGLKEFPDHLKSAARFKDTAFMNGMARRSSAPSITVAREWKQIRV
jgi:sialate O-acetylesterase